MNKYLGDDGDEDDDEWWIFRPPLHHSPTCIFNNENFEMAGNV